MNIAAKTAVRFYDYAPEQSDFLSDVLTGLARSPKQIAPKYFYDQRGSELFDEICKQPEYYPTRTEIGILQHNANDIARSIGPDCVLVELGSGASEKVRLLFDALSPARYMGVDISKEFLLVSTRRLAQDYPELEVHAVCADFSQQLELPSQTTHGRMVAFFPGSSIGNFEPEDAVTFLRQVADCVGSGGQLLIGVDLKKNIDTLNRAYNDAAGVTAQFNLNLLRRMQTELDAEVDPAAFSHHAFFNSTRGRIEMHLVSERAQELVLADEVFEFAGQESIHTESSYKYQLDDFAALAGRAGFSVERVWTDAESLFSVQLLSVS
ncbi:MAG: L-histidine N(alpha)-methyltransferase [Gammaproteobacteria bacterium]